MVLKAQVFLIDSMLSVIVIIVVALLVFSAMASKINYLGEETEKFKQEGRLFFASQALVMTSGFPKKWNTENVKVVGLALFENNTVMHHEISLEKIKKMKELGEEKTYSSLLLPADSCITIRTRNANLGFKCDHKRIKVIRFALCGGEECVIEIS